MEKSKPASTLGIPRQKKLYEAPLEGSPEKFVFTETEMDNIPTDVAMNMEDRRQKEENYLRQKGSDWEKVLVTTDGKIETYVASLIIKSLESRLTFFVDRVDGKIAGEGRIYKKIAGEISNKNGAAESTPGYTENKSEFRGLGLGERRLAVMNAYSQSEYGTPLYSSFVINSLALRLWRDMERRGRAEETTYVDSDNRPRYRFVK